jgi:hypothetical protein
MRRGRFAAQSRRRHIGFPPSPAPMYPATQHRRLQLRRNYRRRRRRFRRPLASPAHFADERRCHASLESPPWLAAPGQGQGGMWRALGFHPGTVCWIESWCYRDEIVRFVLVVFIYFRSRILLGYAHNFFSIKRRNLWFFRKKKEEEICGWSPHSRNSYNLRPWFGYSENCCWMIW